jgi:hypothetical protein
VGGIEPDFSGGVAYRAASQEDGHDQGGGYVGIGRAEIVPRDPRAIDPIDEASERRL